MSKISYIIIAILAIALCVFILWKGCAPNVVKEQNNINQIQHTSDSLAKDLDSVLEGGDILKAQLRDTANYWAAKYNSAIGEQKNIRVALDKEQAKTRVLLNELTLITNDTSTTIADCTELQHEVNALLATIQYMEHSTDTTNTACGNLMQAKDSIIAIQSNQIDTLRASYSMQRLEVNKAILQASVELKQIKRQATWEKIFAIVAGSGVLYSIIKK